MLKLQLTEYAKMKQANASPNSLTYTLQSLQTNQWQTVWREMVRQRKVHKDVDALLSGVPEVLCGGQLV